MASIDKLIARLGIIFSDTKLIRGALTHKSYSHEHPDRAYGLADNERLEFLGDSIINYLAADLLFQRFPDRSEGDLTKLRTTLIKTGTLADFARELSLGDYILMSKGEESSGARSRVALLADSFEALLAAIYLDRGLDTARSFLAPFFERQLDQTLANGGDADYKTQLQALVQGSYNITPFYRIVDIGGPEHRRDFTAEAYMGDERIGSGRGASKQAAEQQAAQVALGLLAARRLSDD